MKNQTLKDGIFYASVGSLWWGVLGTYFFQYISYAGTVEVVVHRSFWTCAILLITTVYLKKWKIFNTIIKIKKNLIILFVSSLLILANWTTWIYAVSTERIIDASYGYFIFPIINIFFGFIFFKEEINKKRFISIILVVFASLYLLIDYKSFPWVGLLVAIFWSIYNLLRKKINVDTDIGLFIESLFILPISLTFFYLIYINNFNQFTLNDPQSMFLLFLAGPMTVIPLFFKVLKNQVWDLQV